MRFRLFGAWIGVATALVVLRRIGRERLALPPLSGRALVAWAREGPPPLLAFALLRQVAIVICCYLLVAFTLRALADLLRWPRLSRLAAHTLPATLNRLLAGGAGLSLAAATVLWTGGRPAAATPAVELAPPRDHNPDRPAQPGPPDTVSMALLPGDTTTITMRVLPPAAPEPEPRPGPPAPDVTAPTADDSWMVEPGDSFWSIAQEVLVDHGTPHPSDEEIAEYWRRLIEANRDRLASPAHPDLLFAGQIMRLPTP